MKKLEKRYRDLKFDINVIKSMQQKKEYNYYLYIFQLF